VGDWGDFGNPANPNPSPLETPTVKGLCPDYSWCPTVWDLGTRGKPSTGLKAVREFKRTFPVVF